MVKKDEELNERALKKHKPKDEHNEEEFEGDLEADFLFNDPTTEDRDGILAIIQGCLKKVPWEPPKGSNDSTYGLLATLISEQMNLGTVIKTDDDDAYVLSVLSILNLKMYEHLESLSECLIALTKQHGTQRDLDAMTKILRGERNQIGFMINERLGNIPTQLIGSLHQCVYDDVKWSLENADDEDEKKYYEFTHLVGISRVFTDNTKDLSAENTAYVKPEERFYCDEAIVKVTWNTGESNKVDFYENNDESKPAKTKVMPEAMVLYCMPINKYKSVVRKIAETFV
ncbi:p21-carboxy-terminal region-binding, putative [Babesia ovis]|uniref:P21-carboxy-terminal region-binding, putative n=1 Tax=Babesia ovis TaxID=5869 RepID=A0A9W5T9U7_BABOV|nr:p21-carboxy-terminal region-binding, putative [Babesia ovis]